MGKNRTATQARPWRIERVRGEPYRIGGRTLTPVARVITFGQARATVGSHRTGGWGMGFAHVTPLAIVEENEQGERVIPLRSDSDRAVNKMLGAAIAVTLACVAVRWLVRLGRRMP